MTEVWKPIEGFDRYEVSSLGNVRNIGGQLARCGKPGGFRTVPAKQLKPFLAPKTGYLMVLLPDRRKHLVHRLVAKAFCEGFQPGLVVDHISGDRKDNRAANLRWVTHGFNIARPFREGAAKAWNAGMDGVMATKTTAIVATSIATGQELRFECASDAVRAHGFDSGGISKCCHGQQSSHRGWTFRFADGVSGYPHKANRKVAP